MILTVRRFARSSRRTPMSSQPTAHAKPAVRIVVDGDVASSVVIIRITKNGEGDATAHESLLALPPPSRPAIAATIQGPAAIPKIVANKRTRAITEELERARSHAARPT